MISTRDLYRLRYLYEKDKSKVSNFVKSLPEEQQIYIAKSWAFTARINQLPPDDVKFQALLWLCGRGFGKTRALCEWVIDMAMREEDQRIALVGRTAADVRDIIVHGESGLMNCAPRRGIEVTFEPSKRLITFPNGSICQTFSAEQPDSLRGVQFHHAACDELAAWQYDEMTYDMLLMTMRLGEDNKVVIATTPQPTKLIKKLTNTEGVHVVRGSTFDNSSNLSNTYIEVLKREYEGTRLGRQELYGEVLLDTPGALWTWDLIKRSEDELPDMRKIVIGVDPAASNNKDSDETGIIVAGIGEDDNYYVLDDISGIYSPHEWATRVNKAFKEWKADRVVIETNQGGAMAIHTLRTVNSTLPVKGVHAKRGKYARAEPIAALYEQEKVLHSKIFDELEEQMTSYSPQFAKGSPDRLDALVYAIQDLKGNASSYGFSFG